MVPGDTHLVLPCTVMQGCETAVDIEDSRHISPVTTMDASDPGSRFITITS